MADTNSRCPRCGSGFQCGVDDVAPCACATVKVDAATLADLRSRYAGCLCLRCLREVAGEKFNPEVRR